MPMTAPRPGAQIARIISKNASFCAEVLRDALRHPLHQLVLVGLGGEADIFVSIHQNAYDGTQAGVSGIETWYCGNLADSGRLG